MAQYGYVHVAEEASRYLDVYNAFRAEGAIPEHKPETIDPTPHLGLPAISWHGKVEEAPL